MADTDDVQGYSQKFRNQKQRLDDADIDEDDRREIRRFVAHLRANTTNNLGTIVGHINKLRLSAERAQMPLTEMTKPDVDVFVTDVLDDEYGLSVGSLRNYRKSLRVFFDWRDEDWADDIKIGSPPDRKHDPDEELSDDEIDDMLEACGDNARDRALIALLADTGLRLGAILSFQIQHVNFDGQRSTIAINEEANVKGDDGAKPVTWSRSYVANWLSQHPRPNDPTAALIHKTRGWDEDEEGALRQQYAGRRITEVAERAGLDGDRVHSHLIRGTAISEWIREGMSDQAIKHRAGWAKDSRMFDIYSRVTDEEMNDVVFEHYEIGSEEDDTGRTIEQCPSCKSALRSGNENFCPACAHPLNQAAAEETDDVDSDAFESMGNAEGQNTDFFTEFRRRFNNDADFRSTVVGDGSHEDSS